MHDLNTQRTIKEKEKKRKKNNIIVTGACMVVNFKIYRINQDTRKLVRTFMLIKKI
jgi:hypothetical protein